jgi:hypothetical protein
MGGLNEAACAAAGLPLIGPAREPREPEAGVSPRERKGARMRSLCQADGGLFKPSRYPHLILGLWWNLMSVLGPLSVYV